MRKTAFGFFYLDYGVDDIFINTNLDNDLIIDKNLATGMKRMRDICDQEKLRQENEDAYNEIRLQMHNRVIKKLRSLKEEWKMENISQVTERIMLAFFKNDI